ncbi:hypothetical protein Alches_07670 [Alicyclobacillus hesperidum subsp. aegles]|nr:hypothetical protein Alches_07670 [Alicyclobacillus hesperidum subsp. aegles]
MALTKTGMTYGIRNSARTNERPRKGVFTSKAAIIPMGVMQMVVSKENATLTQRLRNADAPTAFPCVNALT